MKYILSYEALQKARQTPSQQSQLPTFRKNYDEAYSQYLVLLEKDNLYDPTDDEKPNDPAGLYNEKIIANGGDVQLWETVDTSAEREKVFEAVQNGNDPDKVLEVVEAQIPEEGYSKADKDDDQDDGHKNFTPEVGQCPHGPGHHPHQRCQWRGYCRKCHKLY